MSGVNALISEITKFGWTKQFNQKKHIVRLD